MTPEQFCYWMQGYVELTGSNEVTPEVWASIKDHLQLVFEKKTPERTVGPAHDMLLRGPRLGDYQPAMPGQTTVTC